MRLRKSVRQSPVKALSVEIPNSGGARQSHHMPVGETSGLLYDDVKNLLQAMERGQRQSGNGPCLRHRNSSSEYVWLDYKEVIVRARTFASGLVHFGMQPGQSTMVGIYSQNRVEWILSEYACYNQSAVVVPLYDTLGPNACSYIINETEMKIVICDKEAKAKALLSEAENTRSLKTIIVIEDYSNDLKTLAQDKGIELHSFADVEVFGEKNPHTILPPQSEDLCTICYTSGTTGDPKGVMLTHANVVSNAAATSLACDDLAPTRNDVYLSFLPLAHMMERNTVTNILTGGGSVGFWRGDLTLLMEDIKALRPTLITVVPRLLNRIYDKVQASANSKIKQLLLKFAVNRKMNDVNRAIFRNDTLWDKVVFKKLQDTLGGRLKYMVSGAAPISPHILNFARCAFGCLIAEGYGQTETSAPISVSLKGDTAPGQVGVPLPSCHVKLIDVPDKDYYASKGQGEICVKGDNVFKGYYKHPEKTAEVFDNEGWLHTGDIGMWLPNGTLKIIDRKKHIFKLSQGEYIAPEKIENIYSLSKFVNQNFIYGESLQSCLLAVVVPDEDVVRKWCETKNIEGEWATICKNKEVKEAIMADITTVGKANGLKSFEQAKDIIVHSQPFTFENGFLTPTSKVKRELCTKHFKQQFIAMYKELS